MEDKYKQTTFVNKGDKLTKTVAEWKTTPKRVELLAVVGGVKCQW